MKKKLISFAIAFALLSQTLVFAGGLTDLIGFTVDVNSTNAVTATVTGAVKGSTDAGYAVSTSAITFDYKAGIDFGTVKTAFANYYDKGYYFAKNNGTDYSADFDKAKVSGNFTITFTYDSDIAGIAPTVSGLNAQLAAQGVPNISITAVDTSTAGKVIVTAAVAPIKVSNLNTAWDTYLPAFDLEITGLSLTAVNSPKSIDASLTGSVNVKEDDATYPFAAISFNSNTATATANKAKSSGGSGGVSGGGSSSGGSTGGSTGGSEGGSEGGDTDVTTGGSISIDNGSSDADSNYQVVTSETTTDEDNDTTTTTVVEENKDTGSKKTTETTTDNATGAPVSVITTTEKATVTGDNGDKTTTVTVQEDNLSTNDTTFTIIETTEKAKKSKTPGGTKTNTVIKEVTITDKPAEKEGFVENGWTTNPFENADPTYDGTTVIEVPVVETIIDTETETIVTQEIPPVKAKYVNTTIPEAFDNPITEEGLFVHRPYISGYPDGEVKPENNMSREEVATAFAGILNETFKAVYATTEQDFPDVESDRWSNDPIALLTNAGILVGDDEGNFNPSKPITRAEFAVIAAKFAPADAEIPTNYFTDIDGHWAKDFILKVYGQEWIKGSGDGKFNPDAPITRAEVMQIINTMYTRFADYTAADNTKWADLSANKWYFNAVMDATTENTFVRKDNGWSEERVD